MAIPFLSNIDLHKKQIIDAALHNKTSAPSAPADGQIYFNSDASVMKAYIYMGSSKGWVDIGGDIDGITAGDGLTTGNGNTFVGYRAGEDVTGSTNTLIGYQSGLDTTALTSGSNNVCIGTNVRTSAVDGQHQIGI